MSLPSAKLLMSLFGILLIVLVLLFYKQNKPASKPAQPKVVNILGRQKVKYPQDYTIVMVGDSMTETLGNSDELKKFLSEYFKGKTFEVLNYGFGATNILSVMDRITKETEHGRKFRPIEEIDYDLILLESFYQNPLSQFPLEQGLKRQIEELDKIVKRLKETNPQGQIIFVATISPNSKIFAQSQVELTDEKRAQWVAERIVYLKNHIQFAKDHNIPLINIFEASLMENEDGNPDYINTTDFIHPSPKGTIFISLQIAEYIYSNSIIPN